LSWVQPVADASLASPDDPIEEILRRESISLAFVAALQRLAPRQRACLLLHDVLGFSQAEVAETLGITASGVNSLLFRAREAARPRHDTDNLEITDPRVKALLDRYVAAWRFADIESFVELVADDIRFSMPPLRAWYEGAEAVRTFVESAIFSAVRPHGVVLYAGRCNGQAAFATYEPAADGVLRAAGLQVLEIGEEDGRAVLSEIVSFRDPELPVRCGLPREIAGAE
jgi:RNA polymerase sigma-70 factor (ECF subfamily)